MHQKRPSSRTRPTHPYPFSAYILKSYSTEHSKKITAQEIYEAHSINHSLKHVNQYLSIVEINSKIMTPKKAGLGDRNKEKEKNMQGKQEQGMNSIQQAMDFMPEIKIKKGVFSEKVKVGQLEEGVSPQPKIAQHRLKMKSLSPVKKKRPVQNPKITTSLRYHIITLYSLLGRRQDYMSSLKGKQQFLSHPLKNTQLDQLFLKLEQSKGRDKGRTKFNYVTNEQLRSLKYKPITNNGHVGHGSPSKKEEKEKVHYDEDQSGEDQEQQEKEQSVDFGTWKRRNGIGYNQKVFIIKGGYQQLRKSLLERGWAENEDVWSPHYDFKWTTRIGDINFMTLTPSQGVNHFNNNHHLTSKYGLTRRLRTLPLSHGVDSDKFYPRCFDLGDQVDFQNFVQNFKYSFAQSVAKRFLIDKKRYQGLQLKVRITYEIVKRRCQSFYHLVSNVNKGVFPTIKPEEWSIITETAQIQEEDMKKKVKEWCKWQKDDLDFDNPQNEQEYETALFQKIDSKIRRHFESHKIRDPQFDINGMRNVWIAKPNFMSRGRGIRCFNNIYDIADYCLGLPTQFVVQKYIQNPLLIEGRKFDIRQWVCIQDFNPPKIWFYEQSYLRFSNDDFSLDNIYNRFAHLTNNAIQKLSKKHSPEKSMWQMKQFIAFVGQDKWQTIQQKMKNIVVWSIKSCQGHVIGKKGSCQLVGYDFMIDQNLDPWLIQVNMSPSMNYSTPVTKRLVKMVLQDQGRLLNSTKKGKNVGGFTCIYRGNEDLLKYDLYNI